MKTGNAYEQIITRYGQAIKDFQQVLKNISGCTDEEAERVLRFYLKHKLAKIDWRINRVSVVHGAYLDLQPIKNAIKLSKKNPA